MISAPKGVLRLAALRLLSESSLSGTDLTQQIQRVSAGEWSPGPGSVYLILGELRERGLITELPKRQGNVRRYVISGKGKEELSKMLKGTAEDVVRQLKLLAVYSFLGGREDLHKRITALVTDIHG